MTLQELFKQLRSAEPTRRQFAWIVDIVEPEDDGIENMSHAVANAECELEDKLRTRDGAVFLGTTTTLRNQLLEFSLEQIDSEWAKVCEGIDSLVAIGNCE